MRIPLVAMLGVIAAWPAIAADLCGQWNITAASRPDYVGVLVIDSEGRATADALKDANGQPAKFRGYVSRVDGPKVEITLTNGIRVHRMDCIMQSSDLWHCQTAFQDGTRSDPFVLTRVGPGPHRLIQPRN